MKSSTLECSPSSFSASKDNFLSEFSFSGLALESLGTELPRRLELSTDADPTDLSPTCLSAFLFSSFLGITGTTGTNRRNWLAGAFWHGRKSTKAGIMQMKLSRKSYHWLSPRTVWCMTLRN